MISGELAYTQFKSQTGIQQEEESTPTVPGVQFSLNLDSQDLPVL